MLDYTGLECPVCGKTFTPNDEDIVVCPECGAPHHRECYTAHGKCGCAEQHGTDEAWDRQNQRTANQKPCPHCQKLNDENTIYCVHCGQPVSQQTPPPYGAAGSNPYGAPGNGPYGAPGNNPYGRRPGYPGTANAYNPMNVQPGDDLGGVTAEDVAKVVRMNARFYVPLFARIHTQNRSRFSFVALFLGGAWLLYRKQYKVGAIFTAISGSIYVISLIVSTLFSAPILQQTYNALGITSSTVMSTALFHQIGNHIMTLPADKIFLVLLPVICNAITLGMNIFLGIKANRWYFRHCVETAKKIHAQSNTIMERETAFQKQGGINSMVLLLVLGLYMVSSYIPMLF